MSKKVKVSRPAQQDLDEIWLYIALDNLEASDRFVDSVTDRFSLLASSPRMGRSRDDLESGLRCLPVNNYLILYRPLKGRTEIVRVVPANRELRPSSNRPVWLPRSLPSSVLQWKLT